MSNQNSPELQRFLDLASCSGESKRPSSPAVRDAGPTAGAEETEGPPRAEVAVPTLTELLRRRTAGPLLDDAMLSTPEGQTLTSRLLGEDVGLRGHMLAARERLQAAARSEAAEPLPDDMLDCARRVNVQLSSLVVMSEETADAAEFARERVNTYIEDIAEMSTDPQRRMRGYPCKVAPPATFDFAVYIHDRLKLALPDLDKVLERARTIRAVARAATRADFELTARLTKEIERLRRLVGDE